MTNDEEAAVVRQAASRRKKHVIRIFSKKLALRKFWLNMSTEERLEFLQAAKTTEGYLHQIYGGWTLGSVFVAQRIEEASGGKIPAWYLRPDVFPKPAGAPTLR